MKPSEKFAVHRTEILSIASQMGMSNVRVFGSVIHGDDAEDSDLDLLVDAPTNATLLDMVELQTALESRVGCHVDVLTPDDLPARFRNQVLTEAVAL